MREIVAFISSVAEFKAGPSTQDLIDKLVLDRDGRSLKIFSRDVEDMSRLLTSDQRSDLDRVLLERGLGPPLGNAAALKDRARQAVERGIIRGERERARLADLAEAMEQFGISEHEIAPLRALLESRD